MTPERFSFSEQVMNTFLSYTLRKFIVSLFAEAVNENAARKGVDEPLISEEEMDECANINIPGYVVFRKIGKGGSMQVYEAIDMFRRHWAVKKFDREHIRHMIRKDNVSEHELMSRSLRHSPMNIKNSNVAAVREGYDMGKHQGMVLIEELMDKTLEDLVNERASKGERLTDKEIIKYSLGIGRGIRACHTQSILHLDIKPNNIGLKDGLPMLFDFGTSTYRLNSRSKRKEYGGILIRAPELYLGYNPTEACDYYSFGVVMYWMMFGEPPITLPEGFDFKDFEKREAFKQEIERKICSPDYYDKLYARIQGTNRLQCIKNATKELLILNPGQRLLNGLRITDILLN